MRATSKLDVRPDMVLQLNLTMTVQEARNVAATIGKTMGMVGGYHADLLAFQKAVLASLQRATAAYDSEAEVAQQ